VLETGIEEYLDGGNSLAAGTLKAFCYAAGEQVSDGAALVEFENAD